jgi:hypothetical protein
MTTPVFGSSSAEPPQRRAGAVGIPARPPGRKAVGILLAPTTGRMAAFTIVGVPLILFLILGFKTAGGGSSSSGSGGSQYQFPGQSGGSTQQAYPYSSPSYAPDSTGSGLAASTVPASDYYSTTDSASATGTSTSTATATLSASPSPSATGPAAVVLAAYADINRHDYQGAYNLGLAQNGQSYSTFAQGYSTTQSDTVTVTGVSGDIVSVSLLAVSTDGTQRTYSGTYTVSGGSITGASLQQVN